MSESIESTDEAQRRTDFLAQQGHILDQLTGTWFNALRIILMAVALHFVLLAGMMAYMTFSTHRRAEIQLDRVDALYDGVAQLQQGMETQWDTDREALQDQMKALQEEARAQLRRDLDALRSAQQDTLKAQAGVAQGLRHALERAVGLAEEVQATSQQYAASIAQGQVLNQQMQETLSQLQDQQPAHREGALALSGIVSENQREFSLRQQLLFYLIADALLYPEAVPQVRFNVGYRWYLLEEYELAMPCFELAQAHKDQLAEFANKNIDRLLRSCQAERDKQKGKRP